MISYVWVHCVYGHNCCNFILEYFPEPCTTETKAACVHKDESDTGRVGTGRTNSNVSILSIIEIVNK